MPYIRVWIHFVWSTKNRNPLLKKEVRHKLITHIKQNAKEKNIYLDCINGYTEHLHCLVSLGSDQTLSKVMQLIKGEASNWFNKNIMTDEKLEWQDEYFAVSVSESQIEAVRKYIFNQEAHHRNKSFEEESNEAKATAGKYILMQ